MGNIGIGEHQESVSFEPCVDTANSAFYGSNLNVIVKTISRGIS
jgi:hypothetical protein